MMHALSILIVKQINKIGVVAKKSHLLTNLYRFQAMNHSHKNAAHLPGMMQFGQK